jgi:hypothetical protein
VDDARYPPVALGPVLLAGIDLQVLKVREVEVLTGVDLKLVVTELIAERLQQVVRVVDAVVIDDDLEDFESLLS